MAVCRGLQDQENSGLLPFPGGSKIMSPFDFVFALFSLILGLAIAEALAGFAKVMKLHARARAGLGKDVRVGWLVPLLAALVILNQLQFWMTAYAVRDTLPLTYLTLLCVTLVVGAYYLFSALVFPEEPADWPDFDAYYDVHNRFILTGMLVINLAVAIIAGRYRPPMTAAQRAIGEGPVGLLVLAGVAMTMVLTFALIFVKRRWLNILLLALMIAMILAAAVLVAVTGL